MSQPAGPELPSWQRLVLAIREEDKTPTVRLLLGVIEDQARRIAALEAEIARLRGDPPQPRSNRKPSGLNASVDQMPAADGKRPGSAKRSKTAELTIHHEQPCRPKDLPEGSTFLHADPFVVQDLKIEACNTRYLLEVWRTPTGEVVRGELPPGIRGHFGPGRIAFVLQQLYQVHVPQPRLLEELRDYGIDISAGQINRIVTEDHAAFHAEKDALLPMALQVSTYVNVDDSGAPHQGRYGSCLCISNEFFTTFHSSASKECSKFLDVLRYGHTDYVLNEAAWAYLEQQELSAKVLRLLHNHAEQTFADTATWNGHLDALGIDNAKQRQTVTEAGFAGQRRGARRS